MASFSGGTVFPLEDLPTCEKKNDSRHYPLSSQVIQLVAHSIALCVDTMLGETMGVPHRVKSAGQGHPLLRDAVMRRKRPSITQPWYALLLMS